MARDLGFRPAFFGLRPDDPTVAWLLLKLFAPCFPPPTAAVRSSLNFFFFLAKKQDRQSTESINKDTPEIMPGSKLLDAARFLD